MNRLQGKRAVITGASSGIGAAIARRFAREGARVLLTYFRLADQAAQVVAEITVAGGSSSALQANVGDFDGANRLVRSAWEILGAIDIWVNNAGADILTGEDARLEPRAKLERLIAVDLMGALYCSWAVAPLMRQAGSGVILNMSWDLAIHGMEGPNPEMFAAVKAGVLGFSKCLARSYAPEVRVNVLAPGWIETAFAREKMARDYYERVIAQIPMRRFGRPEDVAEAALFLASDEASYITGQVLNINGGLI